MSLCSGIWMETSSALCQKNCQPSNTCSWCKFSSVFSLCRTDQSSRINLCPFLISIFHPETWATTRSTLWPTRPSLTWASSPLCKSWPDSATSDQRASISSLCWQWDGNSWIYITHTYVIIFALQNPELQLPALHPQNGLQWTALSPTAVSLFPI